MSPAWPMLVAVALDALLGEPRRAHPLVMFGRLASAIETRLHRDSRISGAAAWLLAVTPPVLATALLSTMLEPWISWIFPALVLYAAIGHRSLAEHARRVESSLRAGDLDAARRAVGHMVSRDVDALDESQVAAAATESVLENGSDAVFGALFWFVLLGAPGAVLYRLANTLDAMWGIARHDSHVSAGPRHASTMCSTSCPRGSRRLRTRCWATVRARFVAGAPRRRSGTARMPVR